MKQDLMIFEGKSVASVNDQLRNWIHSAGSVTITDMKLSENFHAAAISYIDQNAREEVIATATVDTILSNTQLSLSGKISDILANLGIPAHLKGFRCIKEALILLNDNYSLIHNITKGLYPAVASTMDTIGPRVERVIRHAIEHSWNSGRPQEVLGFKVQPTNAEFLATIVERMLLKEVS